MTQPLRRQLPCGFQYQAGVAAATPPCSYGCGRGSIGNCTHCGKPVCGVCYPHAGPLLCGQHAADAVHAERRRRYEADQRTAEQEEKRRKEAELASQRFADPKARREDFAAVLDELAAALPMLREHARDERFTKLSVVESRRPLTV